MLVKVFDDWIVDFDMVFNIQVEEKEGFFYVVISFKNNIQGKKAFSCTEDAVREIERISELLTHNHTCDKC